MYVYLARTSAFFYSPCSISEQDFISLLYRRPSAADSKHNQTLWSPSGVELKAFRAEFFGDNLQLPSACERSQLWNFSISSLHSSCPHRKPTSSSTADHVIHAPQGGLPSSSKFLDLSGKRFISIQTTGAEFFLPPK